MRREMNSIAPPRPVSIELLTLCPGRGEGTLLVLVAVGVLGWLYRRSPVLLLADREAAFESGRLWRARALARLALGMVGLLVGAELVVRGSSALISSLGISETFFGMTVVAIGESLEETARMVAPARRGHPELAWGTWWAPWSSFWPSTPASSPWPTP